MLRLQSPAGHPYEEFFAIPEGNIEKINDQYIKRQSRDSVYLMNDKNEMSEITRTITPISGIFMRTQYQISYQTYKVTNPNVKTQFNAEIQMNAFNNSPRSSL